MLSVLRDLLPVVGALERCCLFRGADENADWSRPRRDEDPLKRTPHSRCAALDSGLGGERTPGLARTYADIVVADVSYQHWEPCAAFRSRRCWFPCTRSLLSWEVLASSQSSCNITTVSRTRMTTPRSGSGKPCWRRVAIGLLCVRQCWSRAGSGSIHLPSVRTRHCTYTPQRGEVLLHVAGAPALNMHLLGCTFQAQPLSFFQTNSVTSQFHRVAGSACMARPELFSHIRLLWTATGLRQQVLSCGLRVKGSRGQRFFVDRCELLYTQALDWAVPEPMRGARSHALNGRIRHLISGSAEDVGDLPCGIRSVRTNRVIWQRFPSLEEPGRTHSWADSSLEFRICRRHRGFAMWDPQRSHVSRDLAIRWCCGTIGREGSP